MWEVCCHRLVQAKTVQTLVAADTIEARIT